MDMTSADGLPPIPSRSHHRYDGSSNNSNGHGNIYSSNNTGNASNSHRSSPPNHSQSHRSSRRRSTNGPGSSSTTRHGVPAASPEVISNLITSLSVISEPVSSHFDQPTSPSYSLPTSPSPGPGSASARGSASASAYGSAYGSGSFGVEYGPASHAADDLADPVSLDELAASPPVIRTSKPPSGYSSVTSPKSPASHRSPSRDSGSAFRNFIRGSAPTSRPSSRGSTGSKNDDTQSIGNLSVERGAAPAPELRSRRSHDSWGKKAGRTSKSVLYMSSKEQLREKDFERKRTPAPGSSSVHSGGRPDPFMAGTAISEEPVTNVDNTRHDKSMESPRPIPTRESSLRRSGSHSKRSSARRSKRDSDGPLNDAIIEAQEFVRQHEAAVRAHGRSGSDTTSSSTYMQGPNDYSTPTKNARQYRESGRSDEYRMGPRMDDLDEEPAPFPAVSQGRRRDEHSVERESRRHSGRLSPGPVDALRPKRSSSRLKRLSAPLSPRPDEKIREASTERQHNPMPAGYERPQSADSIDDAVESYLCSPRLSQKIKHPQTGRVISFSEVGDAEGFAVFCCVGMGLTRYITAFYDELALTLKLRLITPDRPGVGDSEAYSDGTATPLGWPDDVYAICQTLKITKFSILAHSAGAIYALATALRMPQHIRGKIHLLAPWIPPSQMNVFGGSQTLPPTNSIPTSQRILRALPTPILKAANSSFMSATSSSITSSLPKNPRRKRKTHGRDTNPTPNKTDRDHAVGVDKENIGHAGYGHAGQSGEGDMEQPNATENMDRMHPPQRTTNGSGSSALAAATDAMVNKERQVTYDSRLTHAIWELATTGANPAVDLLVCLERRHTIGFRYVDITRPVVIHHGSRDTRVPVENVKWLGKAMRRCEVRVLEGEGHGLMASAVVMGGVLMEMSREWEDWMRVTGADGRKERGRRGTMGR